MPTRKSADECEAFFNFLYGEESGVVYAPVKELNGTWDRTWFDWPSQRKELIHHVRTNTQGNVYVGPALFASRANALIANVRGSNVVWADFDGNAPSDSDLRKSKVPLPSVRIQSSIPGHEHLYWKLPQFETDLKTFQDINKGLAYLLDADLSGWDGNQVLRPVGSVNHKRSATATLKSFTDTTHHPEEFASIPSIDKVHFDETAFKAMGRVPKLINAVHRYPWTDQELNILYRKEQYPGELNGRRHALLFRLGSLCAEKGLPDSDIYAIVSGVDKQPGWQKYSGRANPERDYIRLIDKVRQKHPYRSDADKVSGFDRVTFMDHFDEETKIEFVLEDYIAPQTLNIVMGKSSSGKTHLGTYICRMLALGRDVMHWRNNLGKPTKTLFFSYEMNKVENRMRFEEWQKHLTEDETLALQENFITFYPSSEPVRFYVLADQARIMAVIEAEHPAGILIDSASMSMAPHMTDEESAKASVEFVKNLIKRFNIFVILIHHPRKEVPGVKAKDYNVDEAHGAQVVINQATTCINITRLFGDENEDEATDLKVDISWRKNRLGPKHATFRAELRPDLTFARPAIGAIAPPNRALTVGRQKDTLDKLAEKTKAKRSNDEF